MRDFFYSVWFGFSNASAVAVIALSFWLYVNEKRADRAEKRAEDDLTDRLPDTLERELAEYGAPEGSDRNM